ncbi:hypothetical protein [uncultured Fretibacterium sp.]|uniref:hypothetical protein n=1 Tax=uncultured Fretibacterium sp. TaxID=1678694 RepID=UPI00325FBC34
MMEGWTWPFVLQQVFMGMAWCFAVWAAWTEVRGLLGDIRQAWKGESVVKRKSGGRVRGRVVLEADVCEMALAYKEQCDAASFSEALNALARVGAAELRRCGAIGREK